MSRPRYVKTACASCGEVERNIPTCDVCRKPCCAGMDCAAAGSIECHAAADAEGREYDAWTVRCRLCDVRERASNEA